MSNSYRTPDESVDQHAEVSVLLVDDQPEIVWLVEKLLARSGHGFQVVGSASGGYEGLHLWEQLQPDVVVLDVSMPDLDGFRVAATIKASDPDQAIVMFSAHIGAVTTSDGVLHVPKDDFTDLPALIQQWMHAARDTTASDPESDMACAACGPRGSGSTG